MENFKDRSTLLGEDTPVREEESEVIISTNPWQELLDTQPMAVSALILNPAYILLKAEMTKTYEALKEELVFADVKDTQNLQGNAQAYASMLHTIKELELMGR